MYFDQRNNYLCPVFLLMFSSHVLLEIKHKPTHPAVLHHDALKQCAAAFASHMYTHKFINKDTHTEIKQTHKHMLRILCSRIPLSVSVRHAHAQTRRQGIHLWHFIMRTYCTVVTYLSMFCLKAQPDCITTQVQTLSLTHTNTHARSCSLPAVTDVPVTGENEFRIVSELSRELIVAWPLFMKRIKAKRLVCLVTISQQRYRMEVCLC